MKYQRPLLQTLKHTVALALVPLFLIRCAENHPQGSIVKAAVSSKPQAPAAFLSQCGSKMTQEQYEELLKLTDLSTFNDFNEAAPRAKRIAEVFAAAQDRRGIFASMYVAITREAVDSTNRGEYEFTEKASELVKRFAERYFEPLHNYLLNGAVKGSVKKFPVVAEWERYYKLGSDCGTSDLNILGTGVNNHMTMDLPFALQEIGAEDSFENDFMKFGDILILKKRESTNLLESQQNVFAASFFDLFIFGRVIDEFFPTGTAATLGFQFVRKVAWESSRGLRGNSIQSALAQRAIQFEWKNRQRILAIMPHSKPGMKGTEEK